MGEFYGVEIGRDEVRGWSIQRLPFEPNGWLKDYRGELREAIRSLEPDTGTHLLAAYASPDREFVDVENVLLYNIGAASYRHLTRGGLEVVRLTSPDRLHHVSYRSCTGLKPGPVAADVRARVSLDAFPADREKPGSWWAAIRPRLVTTGTELDGGYEIEILLRGDAQAFVSLVKPMLDGLISALHSHDGTHEHHVLGALARYGEPRVLWDLLNDSTNEILGRRTLLRPHGAGVAWNPADDRCSRFSIIPTATGPLLSATVRSAAS